MPAAVIVELENGEDRPPAPPSESGSGDAPAQGLSRRTTRTEMLIATESVAKPEIQATEAFRAAAPDRVDVWIAPEASHTAAFQTYPAEWERRVIAFLDDTLEPS